MGASSIRKHGLLRGRPFSSGLVQPLLLLPLLVLAMQTAARGEVDISLTDGTTNASSGTYLPGSSFTLKVNVLLTSSTDTVGGIDYMIAAPSSGLFQLTGKTSGTFFNDPNAPDSSISSTSPETLDPSNGTDLGGGNVSGMTLTGAAGGTVTQVATTLTLKVLSSTPRSQYAISFYVPGTGSGSKTYYDTGGQNDVLAAFKQTISYTVNTPEPSVAASIGGMLLMLVGQRRRNRNPLH